MKIVYLILEVAFRKVNNLSNNINMVVDSLHYKYKVNKEEMYDVINDAEKLGVIKISNDIIIRSIYKCDRKSCRYNTHKVNDGYCVNCRKIFD